MKVKLTYVLVLTVLPFLNFNGSAQGQTANTRQITGNYRIVRVADTAPQQVMVSLEIRLFDRTSETIQLTNLAFRQMVPFPGHSPAIAPRVQPVASFVELRPGTPTTIKCDLVLSRHEYLDSRNARVLQLLGTIQNDDGPMQTQMLRLHRQPYKGVN